ncbi:hypothetical protein LNQ82_08340 [Conchiformibius steedae DSM 2580]|uniref:Oligosaccharide flippase family protein n=1 Tax=Conchiformibius steedae DSM 2580 TaxID=1121352 RepID=A0AAE9HV54_9NEIS|nr:hypothetical protein [Conchiformibius steedae]QMT34408.1 hypothetical protein H3L98_05435 [Conchiformibius steedae]URD67188.1 hypothetical protein LNQ82_08340 [Conchiformibius steedae DSM 2580]
MGNALSRVLMIIATILMVKVLGDDVYSKYAVLYNGILGIQVFLTMGLNTILMKKVSEGESIIESIFEVSEIIFGISIIFFLLFFSLLENNLIRTLDYFKEVSFFTIIFSAISIVFFGLLVSVLYGLQEKIKIAKLNILNAILVLSFLVFFSIQKDLNLILLGLGLGNLLSICLFLFLNRMIIANFISRDGRNHLNNGYKKISNKIQYVKKGFPIFLSALLVMPVTGVIYTLMYLNGLGKEIAIFSVAMQWYSIILFVPGVLANLLLVEFSKNRDILNLSYYIKRVFINFIITILVSILVFVLLLFVLPIYGKEYEKNMDVFLVFILVALVNSLNTVAGQFFISTNKQIWGFYCNVFWAMLVLAFVFFALEHGFGILGVSLSFLFSYLWHALNQNLYIYMYLKGN